MAEQKNRHRRSNRFFLKVAGRQLRAYSTVTHRGRSSGREYRNPVGAWRWTLERQPIDQFVWAHRPSGPAHYLPSSARLKKPTTRCSY
jgi:hypothetical protein